MANHLDLEEQEQLDQLKHFWKQYGNAISWALIVVLGAFAAWNGYQYWTRSQAAKAAALFDEVEKASVLNDVTRIDRVWSDMESGYGKTSFANQAALSVAKVHYEKGNSPSASNALGWVAEHAADEGYQAVARLRQVALLIESKKMDDAQKLLTGKFPPEFESLVADRKGDIYSLLGKPQEAKAEYEKAFKSMDARSDYRRLIQVKLASLGVDADSLVKDLSGSPKQ